MKRALISGITGQDGSYLAEYLVERGYEVWGLLRRTSLDPMLRIEDLARSRTVHLLYGNLRDVASLERAFAESMPDEIYNLAAQSDVGISFKCPEETAEINYYGVGRLVNAAVKENPRVRIYQASTSEMFGKTKPPQNEESLFAPVSPYGEAKLKAHEDYVVNYRERHGIFICSGILFNHESPRRGKHFVTRKITHSLSRIKFGLQEHVVLGNLEAKRDWGFAGDYVRAMHLMLQQKTPEDYVIATGKSHSVREFVEKAFEVIGMPISWQGEGFGEVGVDEKGITRVSVNKDFYRPTEVDYLCGDSSKAKKNLGWEPAVSFEELIEMMVAADLENVRREMR